MNGNMMKSKKIGRRTLQFNVRAPERLLEELGSISHHGESLSKTALRLMEEGVRMEKYPGILFSWGPSGRRAFVMGTGLSVWEICRIWQDFGRNVARVTNAYPDLKSARISVAVSYREAYIHEMPVGEWGEKPSFAREVKV